MGRFLNINILYDCIRVIRLVDRGVELNVSGWDALYILFDFLLILLYDVCILSNNN